MKCHVLAPALAVVLVGATVGCTSAIRVRTAEPAIVVSDSREAHKALGIPPGHLPPPGQCRVWYPGRPPGRQPRPQSCRDATSRAPAGTWVLYRPTRERQVVHARIIDSRRAGVVLEVRVYDAARGNYLRTER